MKREPQRVLAHDQLFAAVAALGIVAGQWWIMIDLQIQWHWVLPTVAIVMFAAIVIVYLVRRRQWRLRRGIEIALAGLLVVGDSVNLFALARQAFFLSRPEGAIELLFTGAVLWVMNVLVFGVFYWLLDAGGPDMRASGLAKQHDFIFPQQTDPENSPTDWYPSFGDYLYLAFTGATSFGPTDAMPYTRRAKAAMAVEGALALVTLGVIIARAVSLVTD
ncbi:MAG: hypothetical protein WCJ13_00765 [Coriobacteriia bacterium]